MDAKELTDDELERMLEWITDRWSPLIREARVELRRHDSRTYDTGQALMLLALQDLHTLGQIASEHRWRLKLARENAPKPRARKSGQ
jgi:hypothetical protein